MLFPVGKIVSGKDFVGRQEESKRLKRFLTSGENIILIAPRRYGKSSLVWSVLNSLKKEGYYIAGIDLFEIVGRINMSEELIQNCLSNRHAHQRIIEYVKEGIESIFKKVELKQTIEDFAFILSFGRKEMDEGKMISQAVDFPEQLALKDNKDFIFFYDEIGDIDKINGKEILKIMRAKMQKHTKVSYVFAGSQESVMRHIFASSKEPFFRFGRIEFLEEVTKGEYIPYIKKKFLSQDIEIKEEHLKRILEMSRGHPYYTQLICQNLYYILSDKGKLSSKTHYITESFETSLMYEKPYLDKLWEELLPAQNQIEILVRIATSSAPLYNLERRSINIYRTLISLVKKGILRKIGKGNYIFTDPFFEEYIRRKL